MSSQQTLEKGHTIYMIRHGEKPPKIHGEDQNGLSATGLSRAQGLRKVFGPSSSYKIGFIMAQDYKKDGGRARPYETVEPLAKDLGIKIDSKVDRDDEKDAAKVAKEWKGNGNVLLCWEHQHLGGIAEAIGVKGYAESVPGSLATTDQDGISYPGESFDLIWTIPFPYNQIDSVKSEGIEGLDTTA